MYFSEKEAGQLHRNFVDLSRTLVPGIGEPAGHPPTEIKEFQTHETHKRSNACIFYSIHCGTHIDTPYHFYKNGKKVEELDLSRFIGRGVLVDLEDKIKESAPITLAQILTESKLSTMKDEELSESVLLIYTGWGRNYGNVNYYQNNPYLSNEAAQWIASKKIKAVGLDFPPDRKQGSDVHLILLGNEVLIIENLTNLNLLKNKDFNVIFFPIKLHEQGGGPSRVVAEVFERR